MMFKYRLVYWVLPLVITAVLLGNQAVSGVKKGHQTFSFRLLLLKERCQIAIWLTDEDGVYVDTI
jgi:hypothetical protein